MTAARETGTIKPCPWCGGEPMEWDVRDEGTMFQMVCMGVTYEKECEARGPEKPSVEAAIESWNRVASLAARSAALEAALERSGDLELMLRATLAARLERFGPFQRVVGITENPMPYQWVLKRRGERVQLQDDGTGLPLLTAAARAALSPKEL